VTARSEPAPVAIVADLEEAREALAAAERLGISLRLASPRGGVRHAGAAFYRALERELGRELVIDCDDAAGFVIEALRLGAGDLVYRGEPAIRARLDAMARAVGGRVRARLPGPAVVAGCGERIGRALARVAAGRASLSPGAARR